MKHLIIKAVILAVLLIAMSVSCLATDEATPAISIQSLTFEKYVDENGNVDNNLLAATLTFSSDVEAEQFSLIVASENISAPTEESASKIVYIDQFAAPENGVYKFKVKKSKIAEATNSDSADGALLYVKMGGMGITEATLMTVVYNEPSSEVIYGDITGDSLVSVSDVIFMLQALASGAVLTDAQKLAGDVNCDNKVDVSDVIRTLQYLASPSTQLGPQK